MFHPNICKCKACVLGACRGQKRTLDPLEVELQMIVSWELKLGPLEEKPMLLSIDPYLQPPSPSKVENYILK